jgi:chemotaxis response regulator CheB
MDIWDGAEAAIVGIGASAGGLEALSLVFNAMPPNTGLVFIIVVHLDSTRQSQLSSLLARQTAMPVVDIQDGMALQINHVYIIAPDRDLIVEANALRLVEPVQPRGHRHPVDVLFKSLAEQRRERAIAVVLSGTGTNGTQGLRDIRANGGLILIQDTRPRSSTACPAAQSPRVSRTMFWLPGKCRLRYLVIFSMDILLHPSHLSSRPLTSKPSSTRS